MPSPATITACTVYVSCPHCGEPVPSPDNGSDFWMLEQVKAAEDGKLRECNSCEEQFLIFFQKRITAEVG